MTTIPRTPRRRWSDAFKKRVVAEARRPGVTVAEIARRYDLDGRRVSNWMKKFGSPVALVPVEVTSDDDSAPAPMQRPSSCVEIDLPCGSKIRCEADASGELVAEILTALRSRP